MCVCVCMWQTKGYVASENRDSEPDREKSENCVCSVCERIRVSVIVSLRLTSSYGKEPAIRAQKPTVQCLLL